MLIINTYLFLFKMKGLITSILPSAKFFTRFFYLPIYFFLLFNFPALAQNKNNSSFNFLQSKLSHLSMKNGLSQNGAFAIEQDSKGFMWFGTKNGLNKYDGYSFTTFTHDPYDSTTISNNSIRIVFNDSRGILWVITSNGEINLMDRKTEKFHKLPFSIQYTTSIAEDISGNIWIGALGSGLYLIKKKNILTSNYQFTNYKHQTNETNSISDNNVLSITVSQDSVLWIGTNSGLDKLSSNNPTRFRHFSLSKNTSGNKSGNGILSVLINDDSTLWLGSNSGLILFNKNNKNFKLYSNGFRYKGNKYHRGIIDNIIKDRLGNLWMRSAGHLVLFNVKNKMYSYVERDILPAISKIIIDQAGNIWIGTGYGVFIYFPLSNRFKSFPANHHKKKIESQLSIRAICEDTRKNIWFSTYNYIYKWNRITNALITYGDPQRRDIFGSLGALAIMEDRNRNLWFTTYNGLQRLNIKTNVHEHFKISPSPYQAVYGVFEDRSGSIWAVSDKYLSKLTDVQKRRFTNYRYNNNPAPAFNMGSSMIYQDGQGDLWFTTNMGLIKFNQGNEKFTIYRNDPKNRKSIYSNIVKCIVPDPFEPDKKLWIGTSGGGLNLFDKQTQTFTHIMEKDGLPNNVVYSILPDEQGNLWLSTNRGLSKYNPEQNQFINYNISDGLQNNEFNTGAFFKSKSGEMFFGGISGFNYFYPGEIAKNDFSANIVFTDFKLFNKPVSVRNKNSILRKIISETDEIHLSYKENFISFEFASLDYYAPEKNKYAFMLEGFNEDWIQLGSKREVTFTNLSSGEYRLQVKGSNSDGIWNEKAASLKIIIFPPWWKTWWAYIIYGILFFASLYLIRRYELNRILLKNDLKLEKIETDKLRIIDQLKSRFFTNISHEFRTPLTLIIGEVDTVLSSDITIKEKRKLQVAYRNAKRLLTLINQLLDISKIETGNMKLNAVEHNIVSFLKSLFYSFESLAESKKIKLKFISEQEIILVKFDSDKIEKVFYNLISNAVKFTPENGKITLESNILNDSIVEIKIKDTGIGIPADLLPKIYDRFFQVDSSQTREHEGTGIGLALAKELIDLHNGKISVNSKEGTGTEFIITLPWSSPKSNKEKLASQPVDDLVPILVNDGLENSKAYTPLAGQEKTNEPAIPTSDNKDIILVVEDNPDVRAFICEQLEKNYTVFEAVNGEDGVLKARQEIPDLIITDVMMPKMNGYQFCKIIKNDEKTSHIPIIMLTAKAGFDDKMEGLETGADAYLLKPFNKKELFVRIKNLLSLRKKFQEKYSHGQFDEKADRKSLNSLDEKFIAKVLTVIENHISEEEFSIKEFDDELGMGRVQIYRKLKALTGKSPSRYIRSIRLTQAKRLIKEKNGNISEIAYSVGFSSPQYFTRCFKEEFGFPPSDLTT